MIALVGSIIVIALVMAAVAKSNPGQRPSRYDVQDFIDDLDSW